jgi:hypothetical protein
MSHRARSQPLLARRARVVLACGEGLDNHAVARKLRCSLGMVGKWRARFLKARLEGLYDEPQSASARIAKPASSPGPIDGAGQAFIVRKRSNAASILVFASAMRWRERSG